jgi:hypothetical protein
MENDKSRDVVLIVSSLCVGALIGVLLAPRAGEEIRQDVGEFLWGAEGTGEGFFTRVGKNLWRKIPGTVKAAGAAGAVKGAGKQAFKEVHDRYA